LTDSGKHADAERWFRRALELRVDIYKKLSEN
jgi:hypothetical protein